MTFIYDNYVSMMIVYVMFVSIKSAFKIYVTLLSNRTIKSMDDMTEKNITFEDLPKAMTWMMNKLNELTSKVDSINNQSVQPQTDQWMNLKELCEYLPNHPAEQTVYGWTSCHQIPFHKRGKRIMFLKSEIDTWLHDGKIKSQKELEAEAALFLKSKRNHRF